MAVVKTEIEKLVVLASGGALTLNQLNEAKGSLPAAGYKSMMLMSLIEMLESHYGIIIDPTMDPEPLLSVEGLVQFVNNYLAAA